MLLTSPPEQPLGPDCGRDSKRNYYETNSKVLDFIMGSCGVFGVQVAITLACLPDVREAGGAVVLVAINLVLGIILVTLGYVSGRRYIAIGYLSAAAIPILLFLVALGACASL
jgi:hypothetical protein